MGKNTSVMKVKLIKPADLFKFSACMEPNECFAVY